MADWAVYKFLLTVLVSIIIPHGSLLETSASLVGGIPCDSGAVAQLCLASRARSQNAHAIHVLALWDWGSIKTSARLPGSWWLCLWREPPLNRA